MQIKFENFEPKQIMNFYLPQNIAPAGTLFVQNLLQKQDTLANRIIDIDGVERCMIAPEVISVRYEPAEFENAKALVLAEIDDFLSENRFFAVPDGNASAQEQAESVADAFIRPTLNRDGGDIEIYSINDGVLELSFTGHCAGCPYAQNTLQNVIVRTFQKYMPQIREVRLKGA